MQFLKQFSCSLFTRKKSKSTSTILSIHDYKLNTLFCSKISIFKPLNIVFNIFVLSIGIQYCNTTVAQVGCSVMSINKKLNVALDRSNPYGYK